MGRGFEGWRNSATGYTTTKHLCPYDKKKKKKKCDLKNTKPSHDSVLKKSNHYHWRSSSVVNTTTKYSIKKKGVGTGNNLKKSGEWRVPHTMYSKKKTKTRKERERKIWNMTYPQSVRTHLSS